MWRRYSRVQHWPFALAPTHAEVGASDLLEVRGASTLILEKSTERRDLGIAQAEVLLCIFQELGAVCL